MSLEATCANADRAAAAERPGTSRSATNESPPRPRLLIVHPALAPYRVDLFNRLAEETCLRLVLMNRQLHYHPDLDQEALCARVRADVSYLDKHLSVAKRDIPVGLIQLLRGGDHDVVVTSEFSLPTILAIVMARLARRRYRHLIWSDENLATLATHGWLRRALRRWCARRVDGLLMCTPEVADAFARIFAVLRERIHLCSVHQAETSLRSRCQDAVPAAREVVARHGLRDRRVVLFVGRLAPVKNLHAMLGGFREAFGADPSVVWALVGSGEERAGLEAAARTAGLGDRVIFTGHAEGDALFAWYRVSSMLVLPSTYEPYGAVVNEALACGVPALVSARAGAALLIEPGRNGYVLSPDQTGIASGLRAGACWLQSAGALLDVARPDLMLRLRFAESVAGFLEAVRGPHRPPNVGYA